jgi:C_GCAxxG_C_C family probable redox protein
MSKIAQTLDCFSGGYNCSQAILSTYCEAYGLDKAIALRLACGLGAGMGRLGEVCGAVSGAYLVIGLKYGDDKEKTYHLVQEFSRKFELKHESTICKKLLGVDFLSGDKDFAIAQVKAICPLLVRDAAEILENMLQVEEN